MPVGMVPQLIGDDVKGWAQNLVQYLSNYSVEDASAGSTGIVDLTDLNAIKESFNGTIIETIRIVVSSDGADWTLALDASGGGNLNCFFAGTQVLFGTIPAAEVVLEEGSDTVPKLNYVYLTEDAGVVSLEANDTGWPDVPTCRVATVLVQSTASGQTDAAFKVHAWTDHVKTNEGHVVHLGEKFRSQPATWQSGVAAADLVIASPDAYISVSAGVVFQLHPHDFPAIDMQDPAPIWIVNDPTTPFKRITTLDDVTQDAGGGGINNRHFSLVLWGSVNETTGESKLFLNLPSDTYATSDFSLRDADRFANYAIPTEFVGTGFLIAEYFVQGKDSGLWVQNLKQGLRGLLPIGSPSGAGITDHGNLAGLTDLADHPGYLDLAGARTMTGLLTLSGAPTSNLHAATKLYVDGAGNGGWVPLTLATASNDATIDFTGIDGTYKAYALLGIGVVPASDGFIAALRVSIAASFKSGASDYSRANIGRNASGTDLAEDNHTTDLIRVIPAIGSDTGEACSFLAILPHPASTTLYKSILGIAGGQNTATRFALTEFGGHYNSGVQAIDGIQFFFSSGNVESGEFILFGLASP